MKYILYFLVSMSFLGCSGKSLENAIDNGMVALSGNKPPSFFKIANTQTMRDYVFDVKDATFSLPSAKEKDFTTMGGWEGTVDYGKDVTLYMSEHGISFHIYIFSSISPYDARARAVEYKDEQYILTSPTTQYGKDKSGSEGNINVHYETHGKENYTCLVSERTDKTYGIKGIGYNCYKFNPERTMAKNVIIRLSYNNNSAYLDKKACERKLSDCQKNKYTSPPFIKYCIETKNRCSALLTLKTPPAIANEYTYEDLQKRSQRILDSLYIKDGWEK